MSDSDFYGFVELSDLLEKYAETAENILEEQEKIVRQYKTIEDRIQFIISFYVSKGLSRFKKTMGSSLEHFLTGYKEHKDVSILFEGIMKNINKALDFLS